MSQPLRQRLTSKEEQQLRISNEGTDPITPVDMAQVNNIDNVLFRCASCQRAFHSKHLHSATGDDNSEVFADHIKHWQCSDCSEAPGEIDELVAWRPLDAQLKTSVGLIGEAVPEIEKEYLIKWKQKSYFRTKWMRGDWVWGFGSPIMRRAFYNSPKSENPIWTTEKAIPEENLRVDIVFDVTYREGTKTEDKSNPEMVESAFVKYKGLNYESSVVESPPDPLNKDRWEDFKIAFCDWLLRDTIQPPNRSALKAHLSKARQKNFEKDLALRVQPELLTGGELMEYQMDGINWLYYKFLRKENAVLADDMGLGKTVQVIGLFATLIRTHECWPFLVVVPNSTVPNWRREIKMWTPNVRVSTYFGSAFARQTAKDYEMFPQGGHNLRSHVVIASYESMVDDDANARVLRKVRWAGLVVDEGQRLKNDKSQLYECLRRMKFDFKAILTGTPLQNNIRELFNLLQFINPELDAEELEERYSELNKENISALHEMIRPCFLRRTKAEVLPFLPPMVQIILPVSMSVVQKKLYKSILGKNPELIKMICKKQTGQLKKADRHNLNNILVQLRKCICHPFLYNRDIEEQTHDPLMAHRHLVEASGKLQLLNLMLPKLRERGNRVLIFSQFLQNLDIVEDFLTGLDMKYCRLDGNLSSREKQQQIDSFNAEDSSYFAFLLSTRSGGVGINLATADTVIIMDPDFNPKQDMQALSRAHRIGQKNTVLVFHLTTKASVEERIMERGKKKLALDHVLIERMEADEDEEDLESILRHGAQALFEDDDAGHVQYDPESIDRILDRSQVEKAEETSGSTPNGSSDQPQFNFARIWQNDTGTLEEVTETEDKPVDDTIWDQILQEREQDAIKESYRKAEGFGRGKRKRNTVNYESTVEEVHDFDGVQSSPLKVSQKQAHGSDTDFQQEDNGEASDSPDETDDMELDQMEIDTSLVNVKARPFKRVKLPSPPPSLPMGVDGTQDTTHHLCIACNQHHALGRCPLKIAGVEHCPLCGLAHLGRNRSCPHLRSEVQVKRMIEALKESKEPSGYVAIAKKYLQGILGDFGQRARKKAAKDAERELAQSMPQASGPSAPAPQSTSHSMQQYSPAVTSALVPNPEPLGQHGSVSSNDFALPYQQTHSQQPSHSRQYQQ
jgi:superfamily II DNA or RNA helicase